MRCRLKNGFDAFLAQLDKIHNGLAELQAEAKSNKAVLVSAELLACSVEQILYDGPAVAMPSVRITPKAHGPSDLPMQL